MEPISENSLLQHFQLGVPDWRAPMTLSLAIKRESDMMAQRLARRAEDREVPGSSPTRD